MADKDLKGIFDTTPITTLTSTDLFYVGQSPYASGDDAAINWTNLQENIRDLIAGFIVGGNNITATHNDGADTLTLDLDDPISTQRELLTANRSYYVRTDGSDSNDGLTDSSGGAFLTIQKAIDVTAALDIGIYDVTINVGSGTFTENVVISGAWIGSGTVTLSGDTTTPTNVVMTSTTGNTLHVLNNAVIDLEGFQLKASSGNAVYIQDGGVINLTGLMDFGATSGGDHFELLSGTLNCFSVNYTISGGATQHWDANYHSSVVVVSNTITLSGTPAFTRFVRTNRGAVVACSSVTFSGSATGQRYNGNTVSVIDSNGGGASFFPGNTAGAVSNGAVYV